ncbi:hypothetical protein Y032_0154g2970 [Ancylostoma ceylanicum]|nr:hypothetical protein Y032_0154g2970 [Ancylostoma ceylanicum]
MSFTQTKSFSMLCLLTTFGCFYVIVYMVSLSGTNSVLLLKTAKRFVWNNELHSGDGQQDEGDLFDFCPFDNPDPWHISISQYVDVKYGFNTDCPEKDQLESITELDEGNVTLKKGYEKFKCEARCLLYKNDDEYDTTSWENIENTTFHCDFIETDCKLENTTKKFIHMRIEEKKSHENGTVLSREKHPDVHVIVLDSVASTQFIRALPRTVNFLLNGMDAIVFRKFNKVGYNSRPNGFASLVGKSTEPVVRSLMKLKPIEPDLNHTQLCSEFIDSDIFIPTMYQKLGYKTFDAEDYVTSFLRYPDCVGLRNDTLDHYYRAFHNRLQEDEELSNIHEKGTCRRSVDNILDFLTHYIHSYKDEKHR